MSNIYFVDHIRAVKDVWVIGDHMARDAYPYLQQLDMEHKKGFENYLYANYDHYAYFPSFTETNVLKMARNSLIDGLNRRAKLPNAVIVLLGEQIIVEDPLFLPSEFERKFKWLLREWDVNIKLRKSSLPSKAYTMGQPRIMWVQGFRTRRGSKINPDHLLKFNNLLRRTCMAKAVYTIPVDDSSFRCFDFDGKTHLPEGFKFLWQEIVNGLQFHDQRDKQYETDRLVDSRLKEIDMKNLSEREGCAHTISSLQQSSVTSFGRKRTSSNGQGRKQDHFNSRPGPVDPPRDRFSWNQSLAYKNNGPSYHRSRPSRSHIRSATDKSHQGREDHRRHQSSSPKWSHVYGY